ncbi:glutathione S-transferase N-terminal domain-containing protein [Phaeobacter sp. BS52]|uniref:Glutaredoxin GrxC n=1 Tax=Phaeobacter piscinae TaxID=1580596 RepID=A0AAN1GS61_9RHOB|nr:glutaredoxin domain-containing protein [Phaeobacter piscinae]ATG44063.1 glutaredoxin GrxC [Phaeobacter piscinae]AUR36571.1 glutaredoxin GrxC [Phaeobacter piscinae]
MSNILLYTRPQCHFCQKLKGFLDEKGLSYDEVNVAESAEMQAEMEDKTGGIGSVPQLFIGEQYIGDCFTVLSDAGQEKLNAALAG